MNKELLLKKIDDDFIRLQHEVDNFIYQQIDDLISLYDSHDLIGTSEYDDIKTSLTDYYASQIKGGLW